jgi:hypothetical protein
MTRLFLVIQLAEASTRVVRRAKAGQAKGVDGSRWRHARSRGDRLGWPP